MFLCLFVEIGDGDTGGQHGKVGMFGRHGGGSLGRQGVQLDSRNTRVDATDYFHGNHSLYV